MGLEQGDNTAAQALHEESLTLAREMGVMLIIAWSLRGLGDVAAFQGDNVAARVLYEENLALAREMGSFLETAETLVGLARVAAFQGDNVAARALYAESLALARETGDKRGIVYILVGLARVACAEGASIRAARLTAASETLRATIQMTLEPKTRHMYGEAVASARAALGEEAFASAWTEGQTMTLEEAIELAMEEVTAPG